MNIRRLATRRTKAIRYTSRLPAAQHPNLARRVLTPHATSPKSKAIHISTTPIMQNEPDLKQQIQTGFADGSAYDLGRPAYSATIVEKLLSELHVSGKQGARILEIGAGTGKFTEALAAREERFDIVTVEPVEGMRKVLDAKRLPGVTVLDGAADELPVEDGGFDAVICAQCFHWFADMKALREMHRVLRPHGALGMVWNIDAYNSPLADPTWKTPSGEDGPPTAWENTVKKIMWADKDEPQTRFRHMRWIEVFDEQRKTSPLAMFIAGDQLFSLPLGQHTQPFETLLSKKQALERFKTYSNIHNRGEQGRERAYQEFVEAIESDKTAVDQDGCVTVHGYTCAYWTTKIPSEGRAGLTDVETSGS